MILSVSRRTDIPNYYSEWFFNRIKEGFVYVRNPLNSHQISRIDISPEKVDCIVFWTKNPEPMLGRLDELKEYKYYFQFTLTGYGKDIEPAIPHKKDKMISVFQELADRAGSRNVIWRYDPVLFTSRYSVEYHENAFRQIADSLNGYTEKCVISFVDTYAKNKNNLELLNLKNPDEQELIRFIRQIVKYADENDIMTASCAEAMDLSAYGVEHNCCIDKKLIEEITGYRLNAGKDKSQRKECGCAESIDIGTYNTCRNGCRYCYANYSMKSVAGSCTLYDPESPLLCGKIDPEDRITERKIKSLKESQLSFFIEM